MSFLILPKAGGAGSDKVILNGTESVLDLWHKVSPNKTRFTVSIEGNIGAGKSALMKYLGTSSNVACLSEPVVEWSNIEGKSLLERHYADPHKWSFYLNHWALLKRLQLHETRAPQPVRLLERSLESTSRVFIEYARERGHLSPPQFAILDEWVGYLRENCPVSVDLYVYLRAQPEICAQRVRSRQWPSETSLVQSDKSDLDDTIERLHALHESWLIDGKELNAPVLVLDASADLPEMHALWEGYREDILCGYN